MSVEWDCSEYAVLFICAASSNSNESLYFLRYPESITSICIFTEVRGVVNILISRPSDFKGGAQLSVALYSWFLRLTEKNINSHQGNIFLDSLLVSDVSDIYRVYYLPLPIILHKGFQAFFELVVCLLKGVLLWIS